MIIYYAGHGHTIKNQLTNESMGYVVQVDAPNPAYDKAGFLTKAVDMNQFNNYALQIQAKHTLFMFDACFAGTIFSGRAGVPPAIDYKTAQPVRQFITSGDESEVVADASIFRREFVNALTTTIADADNDGFLTASKLSLYLYIQVSNSSNGTQHPVSGKLKNASYNKGDFVFVLDNHQPAPIDPNIDDGKTTTATGNLKLITDYSGTVKITSISGSQLQTKTVSAGSTYDFYSLPAGIVVINIYSGSSLIWTNKVNIQANGTTTIKAEKTTGSVQLITQISGSLYLDGTFQKNITAGNTYTISDLTSGNHTLKIGNDWQETVYITAGKTTTIQAEKPTGTLKLTTNVSGNFYIDDIMREYVSSGNVKTYTDIEPGSHSAKIISGGQTIWQSTFTVYKNQTTSLTAQNNDIPQNMVLISAKNKTFKMGSPSSEPERWYNETLHQVTFTYDFYMGKYEVTQKEYKSLMGYNPSWFEGDNLPVEMVSWWDAIKYCNALSKKEGLPVAYNESTGVLLDANGNKTTDITKVKGYRLPTEAEWEYACRAGSSTPFNTGNNLTTSQANYDGDYPYNGNSKGTYRGKTIEVGSFSPNAWGLYDMHGNVWEWCHDWKVDYTGNATNPIGPSTGSNRVLRGGGWSDYAEFCRSANRDADDPTGRLNHYGFRIARSQ